MTKHFRNMLNDVAYGDCIDVMEAMPWACVDFILTDPPYQSPATIFPVTCAFHPVLVAFWWRLRRK
jgi:predicted methyltransferase